jgi:ketosteroid isomerase-like protein
MGRRDFSRVTKRLDDALADLPAASAASSPQQHLRSVHDQIEAIGRGDLAAALANARDDVRLEIFAPPDFQWVRRAVGLEELRHALQINFESVDDQRPEITSVMAQGDTVVLLGRARGRIKATGVEYDMQFVQRFSFEAGRLASITVIAART